MAEDFAFESDGYAGTVDMGVGEAEPWAANGGLARGDGEADQFGKLFRHIRRRVGQMAPVLKRLAPVAGRMVLGGAGGPLGALAGNLLREDPLGEAEWENELFHLESLGESEDELEADGEEEDEPPGLSGESEAMAELMAAAAGAADSEEEAAGLIGGVTIHILGPAPVRVRRMTPVIVRRATRLTRLLRRSPSTRPLVPVVASITRATTKKLARQAASGKPVTPATVARTMARQTARTLQSPSRIAKALTKNAVRRRRLDLRAVGRAET